MKKRIFIALPISLETQKKILMWEEKIKNLPLRIIPPQNLHITVIPPWYEENIINIKQKLESLKNTTGKIKINFYKICLGPNLFNPRLIWIEGNTPSNLLKLKESLEKTLEIKSEHKKFKTHITIARFNPFDSKHLSLKKIEEKINWDEEIENLALMESLLSPQGANYKIITSIKL